ncbi:MAG: ECF transporter S component [Dehalococcoidia bacterium]|nr:ECF transporter S component [Dehalococcoidia bacterium]
MAVSTVPVRLRFRSPSLSALSFVVLNATGLAAYLYPFIVSAATEPNSDWFAHNTDGPLVVAVIGALAMVMVISELSEGTLNSKSLAALGVMAAMAGVMRTISLPAGASLYFFLVILGGYTFGFRFGFLLGAMSFFISAIVTAGFGPWLPFQVFAAAWMGSTAGLLRGPADRWRMGLRPQIVMLVLFGIGWGLLFGAVTNLWAWPFFVSGPDISYEPGLGLPETVRRYWNYYLLTSFGWDAMRSLANAVLLATLGPALLRALDRYRERFTWSEG